MRLRNVHFVLLLQANEFVKLCLDNGAYHFDTASMSVNYSILLTHSPINREMWTPLFSFFVICFAFENFLIVLRDQNLGAVICSIFFFYRYASGKSEEIMGNNELLNIEPKVHVKSLLEIKKILPLEQHFPWTACKERQDFQVQRLQMYEIKVVCMHLLQVEIATKSFPFAERGIYLGILKLWIEDPHP